MTLHRHGDRPEFGEFRTFNGLRYELYSTYSLYRDNKKAATDTKKELLEDDPTIKVRIIKNQGGSYAVYIRGGKDEV